MPRLQILELPTIYRENGPDETPFVLVIDQATEHTCRLLEPAADDNQSTPRLSLAAQLGARAVLVFEEETVEIPANDWHPAAPNAAEAVHIVVEGDSGTVRQQFVDEVRKAQDRLAAVPGAAR
jgi:hypothetical protein